MIGTLLFLLLALVTVIGVIAILVMAIRGRKKSVKRMLVGVGSVYLVYAIALVTVSLLSKAKDLRMNQDKCFDDWCAMVKEWKYDSIGGIDTTAQRYYIVTFKVTSQALQADMRPDHPRAVIIDDKGNTYKHSVKGQEAYDKFYGPQPPLDKHVNAGETFLTAQVYETPLGSTTLSVYLSEGGWPTWLIIGDENSFLHAKQKIVLF